MLWSYTEVDGLPAFLRLVLYLAVTTATTANDWTLHTAQHVSLH